MSQAQTLRAGQLLCDDLLGYVISRIGESATIHATRASATNTPIRRRTGHGKGAAATARVSVRYPEKFARWSTGKYSGIFLFRMESSPDPNSSVKFTIKIRENQLRIESSLSGDSPKSEAGDARQLETASPCHGHSDITDHCQTKIGDPLMALQQTRDKGRSNAHQDN